MKKLICTLLCLVPLTLQASAFDCSTLPSWQQLKDALTKARNVDNGGLNLDMWGTLVAVDGTVCAVAFTGNNFGDQWLGSRVISAQKANTSNAFSLNKLSLSTANLYSAVQPGGALYGLQHSNPVDTQVAYTGSAQDFGKQNDPMVGKRIGGVNVFGGGLALYNPKGERVGAVGVSGDTSCADHNIAWRLRSELKLDFVPSGVSLANDDNIIYLGKSEKTSGFKHPRCGGKEDKVKLVPIRKKES
ncbi:MAG: heme-binding protein [Oligoflexia bacterium]|nr:heme-binding protein [Oligoflexia bacterium]